ncbi:MULTISPECIES: AIPR family protein [Acidiphilium]|uniref:AIPR protein n=1 Tax=Acidiphilium rubrum TaxID=526 RepID=A0A8G2FHW2_ACIRU|nr:MULTISPECIES: AIPR family protein [Acidiphilium]SIR38801.1 AIPR protein [Acidiphilium rubrum]
MIDVRYPKILDLFAQHRAAGRTDSVSFLIWYLENYYRLDPIEAVDAVCDQPGDKGVDGIFVNDNNQTITIFQSRLRQNPTLTVGDTGLKEFAGTLAQFETAAKVEALIAAAGTAQVAALARRLDLVNKISTHELRGEFVSNADLDANGEAFLAGMPRIAFVGKTTLVTSYISESRSIPPHAQRTFDIGGFVATEYVVDADKKALIAPVKASELVALDGIADQSVFAFNVRGPLGKTGVNKDIVTSIEDVQSHKLFPLFHNGVTVISKELEATPESISITDYFVVNGCQSLTALYSNRNKLSPDLRILAKFIKMDPDSELAHKITSFSNNQNGVKPRDFKSNHPIQIRLKNEFIKYYGGQYVFEIKRGEVAESGITISNEDAGLYLRAFDLKEPWTTHRKSEVLDDRHADLFGRPEVTADRIVLCHVITNEINNALPQLENQLIARYVLIRYLMLYIVREVMDHDAVGKEMIQTPAIFVRDIETRKRTATCVRTIVSDLIIDFNGDLADVGEDFDYRDSLRDSKWVIDLRKKMVAGYLKQVQRGRIDSLSQEWTKSVQ